MIYVSTNSFSKTNPGAITGPIFFMHGLKFAESLHEMKKGNNQVFFTLTVNNKVIAD
jgi:hypothetical protein